MTNLAREGMRPLTQGFTKVYVQMRDHDTDRRPRGRKHKIDPSITTEQFVKALETIGVERRGSEKGPSSELARVLSISRDRAQEIIRSPSKLTDEQQDKLMRRASEEYCSALSYAHDIDSMYEQTFDKTYLSERADAQSALDEIARSAALLGSDLLRSNAELAAQREYQLRALVEGFSALGDGDRTVILRVLYGLLGSYRSERAKEVVNGLHKTDGGRRAGLSDLANLVAAHNEYLDVHLASIDAEIDSVNEYWPFDYESSTEREATVLDEYAGYRERDGEKA